jgi:hypothetical protein
MVMMMIASALHLHLRMTGTRRDNVENAQLARAVLRHITNDLRSAVYVDAETIEAAQVATDDANEDGEVDDAAASEQIDPSTMAVPGLYGDLEQIRFDISRTADTKTWSTPTDNTAAVAADFRPSPMGSLQTVSYSLIGSQTGTAIASYTAGSSTQQSTQYGAASGGGLIRQVVDQPIASWAIESGGAADLGFYAELLAPEVISISFRYSDGTQWLEYWDSYQQGGLPVAVEVTIVLASTQSETNDANLSSSGYFDESDSVFTTIVHLPTALPTDETEALY